MSKASVFNQLSAISTSNLAKRRHSCKKKLFSDVEYPEVASNMVGPSTTPSKSKRKQLALNSESDAERSSGLKEILIEPEGTYQRTRIQTRAITLVDYNLLERGIEVNDEHSAIVESHSSNSQEETQVFAYMANTPKEMARRFEEQSRAQ